MWCSLAQGFKSLDEFVEHLAMTVDIVFPVIHGKFGEDGGIQVSFIVCWFICNLNSTPLRYYLVYGNKMWVVLQIIRILGTFGEGQCSICGDILWMLSPSIWQGNYIYIFILFIYFPKSIWLFKYLIKTYFILFYFICSTMHLWSLRDLVLQQSLTFL